MILSVLIFGFVVYYTPGQTFVTDPISIVTLIQVDPSIHAILIILLVLVSIMIFLFSIDVANKSKSESEKTWYS